MTLVPSSFQNLRVIEHLEAKSAYIGSLKYDNLTVNEGRADIGYHFKVKDPNLYKEFEEGDVLGFFKSDDGTACVQLLDSQNGKQAFMAGVISRSAYLEATPAMSQNGLFCFTVTLIVAWVLSETLCAYFTQKMPLSPALPKRQAKIMFNKCKVIVVQKFLLNQITFFFCLFCFSLPSSCDSSGIDPTDVICVIGIIKVKCMGSVRAGERIYSNVSPDHPGTAIPESHLPPCVILGGGSVLLGMSMEEKEASKLNDINLVQSFVCMVLGVSDKEIKSEIGNMYNRFDVEVAAKLRKERRKASRSKYKKLKYVATFKGSLIQVYDFSSDPLYIRMHRRSSCSGISITLYHEKRKLISLPKLSDTLLLKTVRQTRRQTSHMPD